MSAGKGVLHSEFNASNSKSVHLLQIWILPKETNVVPRYDQKTIPKVEKRGRWRSIVTPDGQDGSIAIRQDASLLATLLDEDAPLHYQSRSGRRLYLHLARGTALLNDLAISGGDGVFIENESLVTLSDAQNAEALLFDLP
jgi:redox-sensitive bicupin YhaK (pirin superfamily)